MGSGSAPGVVEAWYRQVARPAELAGRHPGVAAPPAPAQRLLAGSPAPPDAPSGCASAKNPQIAVAPERFNLLGFARAQNRHCCKQVEACRGHTCTNKGKQRFSVSCMADAVLSATFQRQGVRKTTYLGLLSRVSTAAARCRLRGPVTQSRVSSSPALTAHSGHIMIAPYGALSGLPPIAAATGMGSCAAAQRRPH